MSNTSWESRSGSSTIIELEDVHFAYGQTKVLKGIDLSVQRGEIIAMLGPNGAGKTTLVENVLGSLTPNQGSVRVLGENPKQASADFWCQIGLVQQHWSDHPKWRVKDQLEWLRSSYESAGQPTRLGDEVLKEVGLLDKRNTTLGKLSGGQRRRIDFACALLASPSLLILDEPTTGLDPQAKADIHDLLAMIADQGNTILLTTHDLSEAEKLATRVLILLDGTFVASGSPRQLRSELAGKAQVTWYEDGVEHVHATSTPEAFLLTLDLHKITGLTVTRPTLEDAYLAMVKQHAKESAPVDDHNRVAPIPPAGHDGVVQTAPVGQDSVVQTTTVGHDSAAQAVPVGKDGAAQAAPVGEDGAAALEVGLGQASSPHRKFEDSSNSSVLGTTEVEK